MTETQNELRKAHLSVPRVALFGLAALALAAILIFLDFSHRVNTMRLPANPQADAIVVLTGGTKRVEHALELLAAGKAQRLLISGVHPGTRASQIAAITSADMPLFECCVDLDKVALNTAGNATETASWVRSHGFRSLLLVTSSYHLPRATMELRSVLPDVELIPYPVAPTSVDLKHWYEDISATKLLLREYMKYVLAYSRIGVMHVAHYLGL